MPTIFGQPKTHLILDCEKCKTMLGFQEDEVEYIEENNLVAGGKYRYTCPVCKEIFIKPRYNNGYCIWVDDLLWAGMQITHRPL